MTLHLPIRILCEKHGKYTFLKKGKCPWCGERIEIKEVE